MMNNVGAARRAYIAKRVEENRIKVGEMTNNLHKLATERTASNGDNKDNLLTMRMKEAIAMQSRNIDISFGSSSSNNSQGDEHASVTLLVPGIEIKKSVRPILLPEVEKLPRYATWNFMDRNQTTRNPTNDKDDKKEFADSEDNIIRMVIENFGSSDTAFDVLARRMSRKPCEVKARYEVLVAKENPKPEEISHKDISSLLDEHLEGAQSSFNKLFCRKCLIFNCKVHGVGQEIVYPAIKLTWADMQEEDKEKVSCGPYCYLQVKKVTDFNCWRTLEKDVFEKGVEIFGKNSCLIARFFGALKTCTEVFHVLEGYNPYAKGFVS